MRSSLSRIGILLAVVAMSIGVFLSSPMGHASANSSPSTGCFAPTSYHGPCYIPPPPPPIPDPPGAHHTHILPPCAPWYPPEWPCSN